MTEAIAIQFGRALRQEREQHQWSQERLAGEAGLNRSYLGEVERGAAVPSLVTIIKLARALQISPTRLLDASGIENQQTSP